MRKSRIYIDQRLQTDSDLALAEAASHHVARVLRLRSGHPLILFNGLGGEYDAEIISINKRSVAVRIRKFREVDNESPLAITLIQGISRGQKMDFTLQKAVELGVNRIVPIFTEHGNVRLDESRLRKKTEHWQAIIIGACEQCGRNKIPELVIPVTFDAWLETGEVSDNRSTRIVLHPDADKSLSDLAKPTSEIVLLAGPEGGLSENEIKKACAADFERIMMGSRILRTETAALVAISACQTLWGDFA